MQTDGGPSIHPPGASGPAGLGFAALGAWSALTSYSINDVVSINGSSYVSIVNNNLNNSPASSPGSWTLIASSGSTGGSGGSGGSGGTGGTGGTGAVGATGDKLAVLELSGQHRAVVCVEAPEPRFEDTIDTEIVQAAQRISIDHLFIEACEPDTVSVRTIHCDDIGLGYSRAYIKDGVVLFEADSIIAKELKFRPLAVRITLTGKRRGHLSRFRIFSREQADKNNAFWNKAFE